MHLFGAAGVSKLSVIHTLKRVAKQVKSQIKGMTLRSVAASKTARWGSNPHIPAMGLTGFDIVRTVYPADRDA